MRKSLCIPTLVLLTVAIPAAASTPDGQTPSQETICDSYSGAAFGLCNAYCEAMDCDSPAPHASATACSKVGSHFQRITGVGLPCDASCPCLGLSLFAAFVDGTATIAECVSGGGFTTVTAPDSSYALVDQLACSQNGQPPVIDLTQNEADLCRQLLRDAAAAQNVACVQPE